MNSNRVSSEITNRRNCPRAPVLIPHILCNIEPPHRARALICITHLSDTLPLARWKMNTPRFNFTARCAPPFTLTIYRLASYSEFLRRFSASVMRWIWEEGQRGPKTKGFNDLLFSLPPGPKRCFHSPWRNNVFPPATRFSVVTSLP